jgi:hypothetical protein
MQSFMSGRSQRMMKMGGLTCPPESGGQHGQSPCERGFRSRIPTRFALEPPDARPRRSRAAPLTQGGTGPFGSLQKYPYFSLQKNSVSPEGLTLFFYRKVCPTCSACWLPRPELRR